jgi:hypothetical protein
MEDVNHALALGLESVTELGRHRDEKLFRRRELASHFSKDIREVVWLLPESEAARNTRSRRMGCLDVRSADIQREVRDELAHVCQTLVKLRDPDGSHGPIEMVDRSLADVDHQDKV